MFRLNLFYPQSFVLINHRTWFLAYLGWDNLSPKVGTSDRIMIFQKNRTEKKIVILDRFVLLESLLLQEPLLLLTYIPAVAGIPFAFGVSVVSAHAVDLVVVRVSVSGCSCLFPIFASLFTVAGFSALADAYLK